MIAGLPGTAESATWRAVGTASIDSSSFFTTVVFFTLPMFSNRNTWFEATRSYSSNGLVDIRAWSTPMSRASLTTKAANFMASPCFFLSGMAWRTAVT